MKQILSFFIVLFLVIIGINKPAELFAQTEQSLSFESDGLTLNGTLAIPDSEGPHPVVVLVHGSGPNDRNATFPISDTESVLPCLFPDLFGDTIRSFRDISDALVKSGIAVFRYDKRTFTYGCFFRCENDKSL